MKINFYKKASLKKLFSSRLTFLVATLHVVFFVLGGVGAWAYSLDSGGPYLWGGTSASYYVGTVFSSSARNQIIYADEEWTIDGGSKFAFSYAGTTTRTATSSTGKDDSYSDVLQYNSGSTGKIALTRAETSGCTIVEADTTFNTNYSFSSSGTAGYYDVRNTMTHEFGHWLHLGDLSSVITPSWCYLSFESTMCGNASKGETRKQSIETDDKNGIQYLYGKK